MNPEFPDVQAGFRKGRGTRDLMANIHSTIEKAREFQINIYFCFIDYVKAFDSVDHRKLWKILKEMKIWDHLMCLLRNLYTCQEAAVRSGHGATDWFQIGKGICQSCILSLCLFNFYAEYIMWNECNCGVVWTFFGMSFLWNWKENCLFPVLQPMWIFQFCWHIECSIF